jgi:hypothetical protein
MHAHVREPSRPGTAGLQMLWHARERKHRRRRPALASFARCWAWCPSPTPTPASWILTGDCGYSLFAGGGYTCVAHSSWPRSSWSVANTHHDSASPVQACFLLHRNAWTKSVDAYGTTSKCGAPMFTGNATCIIECGIAQCGYVFIDVIAT